MEAAPALHYLDGGATAVDVVVEVTARDGAAAGKPVEAAEVIIIDCSRSMTGEKISAARAATKAAVDCLRDGMHFAVIAGTIGARQVYPPAGGLAVSGPETRAYAKKAVSALRADGGTAIGTWLVAAAELLMMRPGAVAHAILLTDGRNEGEPAAALDAAIARVTGVFQCDCRGVGDDWEVEELRKVTSALLGELAVVEEPTGLTADFEKMVAQTMGKTKADVRLRVVTPARATVRLVRQVHPTVEDLTSRGSRVSERRAEYPAGAWGTDFRAYHIAFSVKPGSVTDPKMRVARVQLVEKGADRDDGDDGDVVLAEAEAFAKWTDDIALSTQLNQKVAHYTGQVDLANAIREGLQARRNNDRRRAEEKLGLAVQLAAATGQAMSAALLDKLVVVDDAAKGRVRLREGVAAIDEIKLDTYSTRTSRDGRGSKDGRQD